MRWLPGLAMLLLCFQSFAGEPAIAALRQEVSVLRKALVEKDSVKLNGILHDQLSYGHSNGWRESKKEVVNHLFDGRLVYHEIEEQILDITKKGQMACVRTENEIRVDLDGKPLQLKLHVLQVWVYQGKRWLLLSRQSTRI
jgi:hypothetical protein